MRIRVNGTDRALADGSTVAGMLAELGVRAEGTAVAVNGEVVPRARHGEWVLADGAHVEVLTAVQGG